MNTEERIRRHLEASTGSLQAPDRLEEVMAEGRRRKIRSRTTGVLAVAAIVAGVVAVAGALLPADTPGGVLDSTPTSVPPTTAPSTVESTLPPTDVPARGVLIAGPEGVRVVEASGDVSIELGSPGPYAEVAVAYPDGAGGLVFQHATTPLPWAQRTILHLPAGTATPTPLVAPSESGNIVAIGTGSTDQGRLFYYLAEDVSVAGSQPALMAIDLADGTEMELGALPPGADVSAGGSVVAMVDRSDMGCVRVTFVDAFAGERASPLTDDCHPIDTGVAMGADGATVAFLAGGAFEVKSLATGDVLSRQEIPDAYMVTAGPGGWAVRTPEETRLIGTDSARSLPAVEVGSVVPYNLPFELHPEATLGPEPSQAELPCASTDLDLPEQDLPAEVADTHARVFTSATTCDYETLAELAKADQTNLSFGGSEDPIELWVAAGRAGDEASEPLAILAGLLTTRPAYDEDAGYWVWPAAFLDPTDDESWAELPAVLGQETVDLLREYPDGYLGYRVGIAADGTWMFYVGGD